jgi:Asp-tRNA(Asn)/Glu-tRNA(Gln) amidotransferase A subunit family amidase
MGVIPLSPSLDHVGFFARDLRLVRKVGKVLAEGWCQPADCLARPRIGIVEGAYLQRADPEMLQHFLDIVSKLLNAGYEIERLDAMPNLDVIAASHITIMAAEAAQIHKEWYSRHSNLYHQKTQELIERGKRIPNSELLPALDSPKRLRDRLSQLMTIHGIDVWISPSAKGAAPRGLGSTGDPIMNLPWTHSGLPTISIPSGVNKDGLPLGLQIAADWYEDERLVLWAEHIQRDLSKA